MFCGEDTLVGVGADDVRLTPLRCKRWRCETCLPDRLRQLQALAAAGAPTTLLTLTINPAAHADPASAARALVKCWRLMRQRLTRDGYCGKQPFIAVVEATKRGWPHLHVLARLPYVPHAYLSKLARKYIGSPIVDIRRIHSRKHAARYVAKYVSKGPAHYDGCKRYWRSQDYAPDWDPGAAVHDRGRRWFREREHIDYLAWSLGKCDWRHSIEPDGSVVLTPGISARWLWPSHGPPDNAQVIPWKPIEIH